ncbi:UPF0058 family protein [Halorussus halophilus]|uniref:UPF0058 family protein n=1 Tax=Halorussus halophilus TaxID=2650975 RepID=UPI00130181B4|nr:UPF0058 family protein [Halorussus halophilus]
MRKVELIYLHALFAQLYEHVARRRDLQSDAFEEYETSAVGPYQVQRRKADHEAAVQLLSKGLGASLLEVERSSESAESVRSADTTEATESHERSREPTKNGCKPARQ